MRKIIPSRPAGVPSVPLIRDPAPIITTIFHRGDGGRTRCFDPHALVQPGERFTADGLYVAMIDGEAVTVNCCLIERGTNTGRILVSNVNPLRPVVTFDDAIALRDVLLGRVLRTTASAGWPA